jgi:hypothetical protein
MSLLLALLAVGAIGPDDSARPASIRRPRVDEGGLGALVRSAIGDDDARPNRRPARAPDDSWSPKPLAPSLLEFTGGEDSGRPSVRGRYVDEGGLESTPRSAIGPDECATPRRVSRPNDEQVVVHPSYLPLAKVSWNDETARAGTSRRSAIEDTWSTSTVRGAIGPDESPRPSVARRPRDDDWAQKPLAVVALREFLADDDARPPIARRQRPDESWSLKPIAATALLPFVGAEDSRAPPRQARARDDEWSQPSARPFLFADDIRTRRPVSRPLDDPWSPRSTPPFLFVEEGQSRPQSRRPRADESWLERLPVATLGTFIGAEDYAPRKRAARLDDWSLGPTFSVQVQLGPGVYAPPQTSLMPTAPPQAPLYALATTCAPLDQLPAGTLSRFASGSEDVAPPHPPARRPPPDESEENHT